MPAFDGVRLSRNIEADFSRCVVDRATKGYVALLEWCRVFLRGESFTMFHGSNVATALLFPMERVFEDYVGNTLRRMGVATSHAPLRRVDLQVATKWLFDNRRVSLRPDIVCKGHGGRTVVLDTKWKVVSSPRDVTVADMHQMYAYGRRYRARDERVQHVVLLYPWHRGVRPGLMGEGRHVSPDGVQVDLFFVDLSRAEESLAELLSLISEPELLEF
jgi:5-methylcytosine-specific restriction enzyme subunit McrC